MGAHTKTHAGGSKEKKEVIGILDYPHSFCSKHLASYGENNGFSLRKGVMFRCIAFVREVYYALRGINEESRDIGEREFRI